MNKRAFVLHILADLSDSPYPLQPNYTSSHFSQITR